MIKLLALMESLPRMHPREKILHEAPGETFGLVQALEQQAAEHFHDSGGIERRKRQKLSFGREHAIGNQGMGVRVEVRPIGAERL